MAQKYVSEQGTVIEPGAYWDFRVQRNNSGLSTTGVVTLIGEAEAGPAWSEETDLSLNYFGPDEGGVVASKYKSGNLVDAFRIAANPANDPDITGAPSRIYIVKTNKGTKAQRALSRSGLADYGILADKSYGSLGNMIYYSVTASAPEAAPTTGTFTYLPGPELGTSDGSVLSVRVNGLAKSDVVLSALEAPSTFVNNLNAVQGLLAKGGKDRLVLTNLVGGPITAAFAVNASTVTITLIGGTFGVLPAEGDTLVIPSAGNFGATTDSVFAGGSNQNLGVYYVTASTSTSVTAVKVRDLNASTTTTPVAVAATAFSAGLKDLVFYTPVTIQNVSGQDRNFLTGIVGKTLSGTATSPSVLKVTLQTGFNWSVLPQTGDYIQIPSTATAAFRGVSNENVGWYQITGVSSGTAAGATFLTLNRLSDGACVGFAATALAAGDFVCYRSVIDGTGKCLELYDGGGAVNVNTLFYTSPTTTVNWLSSSTTPNLLTSTNEYRVRLLANRQSDNVQDEIVAGGDVVLRVGYTGTTATLTLTSTNLTTTVSGGSGLNLNLKLSDFKRVADLVAYINTQTGYRAALTSTLMGQLPVSVLDLGIYSIASELGATPGRIKKDAYDFFTRLTEGSSLLQLNVPATRATTGLPEVTPNTFLVGGSKGATTDANVIAALDAVGNLRTNFVVPLFSQDATKDIALGLTEPDSSYTINSINAATNSHVIEMSKYKRRRQRQGVVSYRGSFQEARAAAQNLANFRMNMTFQDVRALSADGIKQYQPWMLAVVAAGMQAAGFYRSLVRKGLNVSSVLMVDNSFTDQSDSQREQAIESGLMVVYRNETGGLEWNSDQTTYSVDSNFVYNSMQAVYVADLISSTLGSRMDSAFTGQSVADISAGVALSYMQGVMSDLKRLKLIAASDDAPLGYKNPRIDLTGSVMKVSVDVKLAGAILFIPISILVSEVQQTATV